MPSRYTHLLPPDVAVWERYLNTFEQRYTLLEYDIRVGLGRDPGPDYDDNIRQMALDLSFRRIDCVAHSPESITIIEITHTVGFKAIGQIVGYPILYVLTYQPILPLRSLLVCASIQSDLVPVIETLGLPHVIV